MDNQERWDALRRLYREYTSYKYDSAYNYALQMGHMAAQLQDPDKTAADSLWWILDVNAAKFLASYPWKT